MCLRKQGPGDARRKRRDDRGRSKGKQEGQRKRSGEEEERKRRRGRRRGGEPCHVADNNPSLTVEVKQQVQSASSLLKWKFIGCPLIRNASPYPRTSWKQYLQAPQPYPATIPALQQS